MSKMVSKFMCHISSTIENSIKSGKVLALPMREKREQFAPLTLFNMNSEALESFQNLNSQSSIGYSLQSMQVRLRCLNVWFRALRSKPLLILDLGIWIGHGTSVIGVVKLKLGLEMLSTCTPLSLRIWKSISLSFYALTSNGIWKIIGKFPTAFTVEIKKNIHSIY